MPDTLSKPASPFLSWRGEHAGIRVPDFDAAVAWYSDKLDFRLTRSSVVGPTSFGFMSPAADDSFNIELLANPSGAERPSYDDLGGSHNLMGWHHLCFRVDDVSAGIEELKRRGVSIVSPPFDVAAFGIRFAFFADPWGNLFELVQNIDG
jgi:catechol 2,3-dioxygenase-like lactoylglutathione lyase family enzyme